MRNLMSMVLLLSLCAMSPAGCAQRTPPVRPGPPAKQAKAKKAKMDPKSLVLKQPNLGASVVFSHPKYVVAGEDVPYQLLTIMRPDGSETVVEDLRGSAQAYAPSAAENQWSPDGRYLVLHEMQGVEAHKPKQFEHQSMAVLDVEDGIFVTFRTASGKFAGFPGFIGWRPGEPHTMIITAGLKKQEDARPQR